MTSPLVVFFLEGGILYRLFLFWGGNVSMDHCGVDDGYFCGVDDGCFILGGDGWVV